MSTPLLTGCECGNVSLSWTRPRGYWRAVCVGVKASKGVKESAPCGVTTRMGALDPMAATLDKRAGASRG